MIRSDATGEVLLSRYQPTPVVVVDVETTGLDSDEDRVIEIAAVTLRDWRSLRVWNELVKPGRPLPCEVSALTGIPPCMLRCASSPEHAIRKFAEIAAGAVVVGHGVGFDRAFLEAEAQRHGVRLAPAGWACTLKLARHVLAGQEVPSYGLSALCARFGVRHARPHRALPDARATAQLLRKIRLCGKREGMLR